MSSIYPEGDANGGVPQPTDQDGGQLAQARDKLAEAGQVIKGETAHFAERAREEVGGKVEEKASEVADALGVFADAIRHAGDELTRQDQTFAAQLAGQAADGLQSFTRTLAGKSPEQMLHAARDLGRTNPTAFVAGAVLAGLAIGRFARSSAHHDGGVRPPSSLQDKTSKAGDEDLGMPSQSVPPDATERELR
jgi:hypothetical protein